MPISEPIQCDLTVIGAGLAGMAAGIFAAARGYTTTLVGKTGEIAFSTGLLDILGVHPVEKQKRWEDPFSGVEALVRDIPEHPYGRLSPSKIENAFDGFTSALARAGFIFRRNGKKNVQVVTPLGTLHTTYCVPQSMWAGSEAYANKKPCLLVDFKGLKGFSAALMADTLKPQWPKLKYMRIDFPGCEHLNEIHTEHMAGALVLAENRARLAAAIKPHLNGAEAVGMPAVLGIYKTADVISDLEESIGVKVFEIPTMPPSMPGLRLKEACENSLRQNGVTYLSQQHVLSTQKTAEGDFLLETGRAETERQVRSAGVILASGRFSGGGLAADRKKISETIFDLPVAAPESRPKWHRKTFFDPRGHDINKAGLTVDDDFRPLNQDGTCAYETLFAAGSILAHQDWKRTKSGAGVALATAWGAVEAFGRIYQKKK